MNVPQARVAARRFGFSGAARQRVGQGFPAFGQVVACFGEDVVQRRGRFDREAARHLDLHEALVCARFGFGEGRWHEFAVTRGVAAVGELGQRRLVDRQPDRQELMREHDCSGAVRDDRPDPSQARIQRLVVDLHAAVAGFGLAAARARGEERLGSGFGRRDLGRIGVARPVLLLEVDVLAAFFAGVDRRVARHQAHVLADPRHIRDVGALRAVGCGRERLARSGSGAGRERAEGQHRRSCRGNESRDHFPFDLWSHCVRPPP